MSFVRPLLLRLFAALLVPFAIQIYLFRTFFPLPPAQQGALDFGVIAGELLYLVGVGLFVHLLAAPVRRGLGSSDPELRRHGALAALGLPARLCALELVLSGALAGAVAAWVTHLGAPFDLFLAGAASATGFALMQAMLSYSVSALAAAPAMAALGPQDLRPEGSVRAKILAVCCGLIGIAALLLGSIAYARYRADTDRQYVEDGVAVQREAARLVEERGPAAAAELVYLASGAPTAVVGANGQVLGRVGGDLSLPAAPLVSDAVEAVPGGWWLRRAAGSATLVTFLSEAPLRPRRAAFFGDATFLGVLFFGASALLVWLAARSLTGPLVPLGRAVIRMAAGDLTATPPALSGDEIGRLTNDFRRMAHGLSALVQDVQAASRGVQDGTSDVGAIGARVQGGAREEHERVLAVKVAVEAMQGSVVAVSSGVDGLSDYVHSTTAAVGEMTAALEEVRRHAVELERRSQDAGADVEKLSDAGRRAQAQLATLDALAGTAQGTLATVSGTLSGLETSAIGSQLAAAQAAEMAEQAGAVMDETVSGIEALRSAVGDAKQRVTVLGRRSDDIDQILDFIGEVAGRTNLLSLNASIIATQAGEHGKAFAVVADQIRDLAAQISSSTKSIARIIGAVRDDVSGTARLIDRGDELATTGVSQARRSLAALHEIRGATATGHESAAAFRDAVQAHALSTRDVSNLVAQVTESSRGLIETLQMLGKSVAAVGSVSRGVSGVADKVTRALSEQSGVGRRQMESLERLDGMLADIARAVATHQAATRRVRDVLGQLNQTAEQQDAVSLELAGVADRLGGRSRALAESVGRFKI
jgi:methyl-accepting chemotaxis protein